MVNILNNLTHVSNMHIIIILIEIKLACASLQFFQLVLISRFECWY